jgi:hypothetical protein
MNKELAKSANAILPAFSAQLNIGGNMPLNTTGNIKNNIEKRKNE